jgi:DNA-binding ferritin-like protein
MAWAAIRTECPGLALPLGGVREAPSAAEPGVTPYETRLLELLERLETTLKDVREHLGRADRETDADSAKALEAFADETFRDRDA